MARRGRVGKSRPTAATGKRGRSNLKDSAGRKRIRRARNEEDECPKEVVDSDEQEECERLRERIREAFPEVNIVTRGKECVLLLTQMWPQLVAWYPEEQKIGLVSNTALPPGYIPSASSPTLLCGFHVNDIMCEDAQEWLPAEEQRMWNLRVAVCSLVTDFQLKLPVMKIHKLGCSPRYRLRFGQLRLHVAGDQEHFRVHLLFGGPEPCTAFTYDSHWAEWRWIRYRQDAPRPVAGQLRGEYLLWLDKLIAYDRLTNTFDAIPYPGGINVWDEYPVPEEFAGYKYRRNLEHFRCGGKLVAFGECWSGERSSDEERSVMVVLELDEEMNRWNVVSAVDTRRFRVETFHLTFYQFEGPLVGGQLMVKPSHTVGRSKWHVDYPVAFHLGLSRWMEPPPGALATLTGLQSVCVYNPAG